MGTAKTYKRNRNHILKRIRERHRRPSGHIDEGKNKRRRQRLAESQPRSENMQTSHVSQVLKFGSMNVNGVNEESRLGIETLLKNRNFDVSQGDYYWFSLYCYS